MAEKSVAGTSTTGKPAVLIIGGLGYIGRFLALYIHNNSLASEVRLVDKVLPQLARLPPEFDEACHPSNFMQADASRPQSLDRIFAPTKAKHYSYVFNCGGETRYSQDPSVYQLRNTQLSTNLAEHCAKLEYKPALIEFSTGMIYKPPGSSAVSSGGCTETAPLKPWLKISKAKLVGEEALEKLAQSAGLRHATLRLAHVYGLYDTGFLSRGLCLARVYQSLDKEMKWLWGKDLRINTVYVNDVCAAAWAAAGWASINAPNSKTTMTDRAFNIVDDGDTSQESLAEHIAAIFGIQTGFQGNLISQFAKLNLDSVVDDVNEDILQPWADLIKAKGLEQGQGSPLTPFMEKELIKDCNLCLNNKRAKSNLQWSLQKPRLTREELKAIIESYERVRWWP
ncbi:uncharacterized protein KY384_008421 [Bacidia gigantensis]|uniref:uncharacterized protein n=1 Tax=Bacidia gigantensis TaxID=2732470 RepID=UPI001D04BE44|nr:uncharacterized protein KY384_008421 [Bacidia gigantensis]KAG8526992.1 hypothetical protein KY384_008421 [Bacidia gigantensis]